MSLKSLPMQEDFKMAKQFVVGDLVWPTQKWWAALGIFYGTAKPGLVTQVIKDNGPCRLGFYYAILLDGVERTIHETFLLSQPEPE